MASDTMELNALDGLGSLSESGMPVKTRLKDVKSAVGVLQTWP